MTEEIYLDSNATCRLAPEARAAILGALDSGLGNASSAHSTGERSRDLVRRSRDAVAELLGADSERIFFTSGATESNNTVLFHTYHSASSRCRIVTSTVEHSSVLSVCGELERRGAEIISVPVATTGLIDPDELGKVVTPTTSLVSIQWLSGETGVVQPIKHIGEVCRAAGVPFHVDAAQAAGKIELSIDEMPVDYLSLSAHKFNGPAGVGAIYARKGVEFHPLIFGGDQERGMRAGTENLLGIVGFGAAAEERKRELSQTIRHLCELRDAFERSAIGAIPEVVVNGDVDHRVCNTTSLQFRGLDGQALVARLDQEGIRCSQSSACSSRRPEPSHVLRSMGLDEEAAYSSVRFSFGAENTREQVGTAVEIVSRICDSLREFAQMKSAVGF